MKVLLVYPAFPDTFWSFRHALKFVGKTASMPPTGLLTVASLLPKKWEKRLADLNVKSLSGRDIAWADMVMVSAMNAQLRSTEEVLDRCQVAGVRTIAGGPLFSAEPGTWIGKVDHIIAGEAENTLPAFINDLSAGRPEALYRANEFPDMVRTPIPDWSLMETRKYETVGIQFSRGCPHHCDFCNVTALFGHRVRTKSSEQIISELNSLYNAGWRSGVFFVDDNFIGNRKYLKSSLLPALIEWHRTRRTITFQTETSILIADDPDLMKMMVDAGFVTVFIGIETPDEESLRECSKTHNTGRNLLEDVKRIQRAGIQVQAGFIVGFDNDKPSVFQRQIDFIQRSGIVTAMVAMLQAPAGTKLHSRLKEAGRITGLMNDGTDGNTNIKPVMGLEILKRGYRKILLGIYSPVAYYERVRTFLREYKPAGKTKPYISFDQLLAIPRSIIALGIKGKERFEYWKLFRWTWFNCPLLLPLALRLAIYGYHCRKIMESNDTDTQRMTAE